MTAPIINIKEELDMQWEITCCKYILYNLIEFVDKAIESGKEVKILINSNGDEQTQVFVDGEKIYPPEVENEQAHSQEKDDTET